MSMNEHEMSDGFPFVHFVFDRQVESAGKPCWSHLHQRLGGVLTLARNDLI